MNDAADQKRRIRAQAPEDDRSVVRPIRRMHRHQVMDQLDEWQRRSGEQRLHVRRPRLFLREEFFRLVDVERDDAGDHFHRHHAERIQVQPMVAGRAEQRFGRQVRRSAGETGTPCSSNRLHDPEVDQLGLEPGAPGFAPHADVSRLDVVMDVAARMEKCEGRGHLVEHARRLLPADRKQLDQVVPGTSSITRHGIPASVCTRSRTSTRRGWRSVAIR